LNLYYNFALIIKVAASISFIILYWLLKSILYSSFL